MVARLVLRRGKTDRRSKRKPTRREKMKSQNEQL
jgi:hypothetical protein